MTDFKSYFHSKYQGGEDFIRNVILPIFGEDRYENAYQEDVLENNQEFKKKAQGTGVAKILRLGTIEIPMNPTDVFDITVSDHVQMRRNRVAVQQLIRSVMSTYSSAFMIFHYSGDDKWDWRFTFCSKQGSNQDSTDSKRYTFLLGPNQSCRTAAENFKKLADKGGNIELNDIVTAFDVEALSKEFFTKYKVHYDKFCQFVYDNKDNREYFGQEFSRWEDKIIRDYVKKLLGRIVFLHFLQKKGWLGVPSNGQWGDGDTQFMKHLFEASSDEQKSDYLDTVLEPLFSKALNASRANDVYNLKVPGFTDTKIPYLNGGLFEKDELDIPKSKFPADYFADLFEFFYEYNFTIDENDPDDAEVGIDPEMLGCIFENLLEDNKDKGAYYTPKEIVQYMCRESLVAYLTTCVIKKHGDNHRPEEEIQASVRKLLKEPEAIVPKMSKEQLEDFGSYIRNVKICDPAIGSGAFPMGLLNELVRCRASINAWATDEKGTILSGDYAALKTEIINNNIYGVDIEKGAIDIARLRFWLSIVVDEQTPEVLPNLDYKFMQGNSLITTFNGEYINLDTNSQQHTNVVGMKREKAKLYSLKQKYYSATGDAKYQLGIDIKDSILTLISYQLGYEIQSWYEKNSAKQLSLFPETEPRQLSFADIKEHLPAEKQKIMDVGIAIRKQLADTTRSLAERAQTDIRFFDWRIMFTEVFEGENPGFDIVIGNPPYIRHEKLDIKYKHLLCSVYPNVGESTADILVYFFGLGIRILSQKGILNFITSNKFLKTRYGRSLRNTLASNVDVLSFIDFFELPVFNNASTDAGITLLRKDAPISDTKYYPVLSLKNLNLEVLTKGAYQHTIKAETEWQFVKLEEHSILNKMNEHSIPLTDFVNNRIYSGVKTGLNDTFMLTKETRNMILSKCITEEEYKRTDTVIKKAFRSRDIRRYVYRGPEIWLLFIPWHFPLQFEEAENMNPQIALELAEQKMCKDYPSLYSYLCDNKEDLSGRNRDETGIRYEWYALQRWGAKYYKEFDEEKLIYIHTAKNHEFYYDTEKHYVNNSCYIIASQSKFLYFFLNSKLFSYFKRIKFVAYGNGTEAGRCKLDGNKMATVPIRLGVDESLFNEKFEELQSLIKANPQADTSALEAEIDRLVYDLYGLTDDEIAIIEGANN